MPDFAYGRVAEATKMVRGEPEIFLSVLLADTSPENNCLPSGRPRIGARLLPLYRRHFSPMSRGGNTGRTTRRRTAMSRRARPRWRRPPGVSGGSERRLAARFRTIQVYPKDLRALPVHPKAALSWHG